MKLYLSSPRHERYPDDPALMRCYVGEPTIGPLETWVQQTQLCHITRVLHSTHLNAFGIACTFRICSCPFQVSPPGKSRDPMMLASIIPLCERDLTCADMAHTAVVIHIKLSACQSREQAGTNVPTSLKGKPTAALHAIAISGGFPIDGFHQKEFEIIKRSLRSSGDPRYCGTPLCATACSHRTERRCRRRSSQSC